MREGEGVKGTLPFTATSATSATHSFWLLFASIYDIYFSPFTVTTVLVPCYYTIERGTVHLVTLRVKALYSWT
jgi:hypothetical protein